MIRTRRFCGFVLCFLLFFSASSQKVYKLKKWSIPPGHYSGIVAIGDDMYAVVSDKGILSGFHLWQIRIIDGKILDVQEKGFFSDGRLPSRDDEGIAFCPDRNSIFLSGEGDQRILEYELDGSLTGQELLVPETFGKDKIQTNRGFEALCYDSEKQAFWTTTESPLKEDEPLHLRLLCFGIDLQPHSQCDYLLDAPQTKKRGRDYCHGLVALAALPDGQLLCLEREAYIAPRYMGSKCWCKLFVFNPQTGHKTLLDGWKTRFALGRRNFANYEGMCLGPLQTDGSRALFLVNDSQGGFGRGNIRLRDYLKVIFL